MKTIFTSILMIFVLVYILACIYLFVRQRQLIYIPAVETSHTYPQKIFAHQNEQIKATLLHEGKDHAIVYFGGNAENVDFNIPDFDETFSDHTLYLTKYRGYSGSSGTPSERALYADALFIYDELKSKHKSISVIGRSIGSGVATYLASKRDLAKLTLITPFDSIENIAKEQFPYLPVSLLLQDKYDSLSRVDQIQCPTLIITAENDEIVNETHTKNLINAFKTKILKVEVIKNSSHNSISYEARYYETMREFFNIN